MRNIAPHHSGRHFLQIPGPTNVPDRVLQAIAMPTIDHRGPEFALLGQEIIAGMKRVFQTEDTVVVYPSSGTGAWEAALTNTLSPDERVLMFETGHFATLWRQMATRLGLDIEFVPGDWRHGVDPALVEEKLVADKAHAVKAVCVVHNETSTGVTSRIAEVREAIDRAHHPALFMVDTISSLASIDYRHDDWKVDVTVAGSQKGLMLPPGLGFNAVSKKALAAHKTARLPRSYWDWEPMLETGRTGFFPYTPATNLLFGLREALKMLASEGLIEIRPNRGSVVAPISFQEISQTFAVMGALEELAGFLVCDHVSNVDIAALDQLMREMHSTHDNIDRDKYADLNFAFHRKIIGLSGNNVLADTYQIFFGKLQRARYCVNYHKVRWDESVQEHEGIMEALRRRDGAELSKRLKEHNARTGVAVLARLRGAG